MVTPSKGDYASIPMSPAAQKVADASDPAKTSGRGAVPGLWGAGADAGPTRLRISWLDDTTLKLESDYGMQTRLLDFRTPTPTRARRPGRASRRPSGNWAGGGRGRGPRFRSLRTVTTSCGAAIRKNGVPYSAGTVFTEHWDVDTKPTATATSSSPTSSPTRSICRPVHDGPPFQAREGRRRQVGPTPCDARF